MVITALMNVDTIPLANTTGATLRMAGTIVPPRKDKTTVVNSADLVTPAINTTGRPFGAMWIVTTTGDTVVLMVKAST